MSEALPGKKKIKAKACARQQINICGVCHGLSPSVVLWFGQSGSGFLFYFSDVGLFLSLIVCPT